MTNSPKIHVKAKVTNSSSSWLKDGSVRDALVSLENAVVGKLIRTTFGYSLKITEIVGEYVPETTLSDEEYEALKAREIEKSHRNGVE
jgi:hypothetical protein